MRLPEPTTHLPEPTDDEKWDATKDHARSLGTADGTDAAEAYEITGETHARALLDVLDTGYADADTADDVNASIPHDPLAGVHDHRTPRWLYSRLHVDHSYDTPDAALCTAYEDAYRDAVARVLVRRARLVADPGWRNAPYGYHKIRVTLTATSNTYLADRLPLTGELEVFEMNLVGHVQPGGAVFREELEDGRLAAPVEVRDIAYTYTSPGAATAASQVAAERRKDPGPFVFDWAAQPHSSFLHWMLPHLLPDGQQPDIVERISEASKKLSEIELTVLVNGIEMNAERFMESVDRNMRFHASREARRMVDEFGGLPELEDTLRQVGRSVRRAVEQRMAEAGIELPDSDNDW